MSLVGRGLEEAERMFGGRLDFVSLQEVPRGEQGWVFEQVGPFHIHSFRDEDVWRGNGIAYRADIWSLMTKKSDPRGAWFRMRRISDGVNMWIGSAHLTQGATTEIHSCEVHSFLSRLPATLLPTCFGMDANTPFQWEVDGGGLQPCGKEGKGEGLLMQLREKGLDLTAPRMDQRHLPTCRPRKQNVQGRHIDVVGGKHGERAGKGIARDSHRILGTDHDMVVQKVIVRAGSYVARGRPNTRPKWVSGDVALPPELNQAELVKLTNKYTRPYKGCSYRDPENVKVCFGIARRTGLAEDWKRAQAQRAAARREWREERIRAANNGDWKAYKECVKKGATGWEEHLATCLVDQDQEPHKAIHDYFEAIYRGEPTPEFPYQNVPKSPDFTVEELRDAVGRGKNGKATGEDGVPHELIKAIHKQPGGEELLLAWYNRLLHGTERLPEDWTRAVMVLLPKCRCPEKPQQLRPICLGASACKVYSRMLLARSRPAFVYSGPFQNMGEGRQTVDYIWVIARLMQLDQEWKEGLWFLKLDIEKAFDSLNRGKFLNRLAEKMGACEELRSWWDMFQNTEARLDTAWGSSVVPMKSGIRQGAVESPQVFASVMDWIAHDVASKHGWHGSRDVYEGMDFAESAFVDDCILWDGTNHKLSERAGQLIEELAEWGMKVNPAKCQVYATPFVKNSEVLKVGVLEVQPDTTLDVMGIPFHAGITPRAAMQVVFARTKNKFWANQHLFRAKTSLAGRLRLMQKVLGGTSLWCVSAFIPDRAALKAINILQVQLVVWSMRLAKGQGETWLDFRMRCFRLARYSIHRHMGIRWGTLWLQRCWQYAGHRARGIHKVPTPGCSRLDAYRTLTWWEDQQGLSMGKRHKARFFPRLMTEERDLNRAAGGDWRVVAQDRQQWQQQLSTWIANQDLPWASYAQLALEE